ncbi:diguanylate cyclase domain-containing protein [Streptomyces zaomyceticus]|uniref:caspase, EACC1-associated type n=1 Tax=Streptomyces zaomyceticus TaxID=68286 RepID=UPI0037193DAD
MSRLPDPAKSRALFIGVDRFDSLDDLPAVRRNLSTLVELFTGEVWGLDPRNCTSLLNPATTRDVDEAIFRSTEEASDTLLIYYAGHGLLDRTGRLHLAMPDSDKRSVHSTAFPYDWARMRLETAKASRRIVILDCCFGARAMGVQSSAASIVELAEAEGTYVLAAAGESAFALAPPGEPFTAFTEALVRVLTDGIADAPDFLDLDTAFKGMQSILRRQERPDPQSLGRNQVGRMPFVKNAAYVADRTYDFQTAIKELHSSRSLADTLQTVADGLVGLLGFELAYVNLVRPDGDLVVASFAGSGDGERLTGHVGPRSSWERRLTMGEAWGELRFIPATEDSALLDDGVPEWLTKQRDPQSNYEWHPQDRLYAPMYAPDSMRTLIGVISVDWPRSDQIPGFEQREALQSYAFQAGIAISNARLKSNMQRALVRLEREQQALRASEESFRQAFDYAPGGFAIVEMGGDRHGRMLRTNDALCRLLGRSASELRRYSFADLVHPEEIATLLRTAAEGGRAEIRLGRRDGTYVWVSMRNSVVADSSDGPRFLLTHIEDIEDRKLREFELAHQASHDPLTNLANSFQVHSQLGTLLCMTTVSESGAGNARDVNPSLEFNYHAHTTSPSSVSDRITKGMAVIFCSLRGFKQINDLLGRDAGDVVLIEVSQRLILNAQAGTTVARIGGDEFLVIMDGATQPDAHELISQLRNVISHPMEVNGRRILMGARFGLAWAECGMDPKAPIEAAREAAT